MNSTLTNWIKMLTTPSEAFGGMPPCPFAKGAFLRKRVEVIEYKEFPQIVGYMAKEWTKEVVIFVIECETAEKVMELAEKCNKIYPEFLFLEEHPDLVEVVDGQHLNSGMTLLLVQKRKELEDARKELKSTNYYDKWTTELKQRIFNR